MRALVQTVSRASVTVAGSVVGAIDDGLLVLVGVTHGDTPATAEALARKVYDVRVLDGERSASEVGAPVLVVSQFTLYGDVRKGRPSWVPPHRRRPGCWWPFADALRAGGAVPPVSSGRTCSSVNVGPTLLLEWRPASPPITHCAHRRFTPFVTGIRRQPPTGKG